MHTYNSADYSLIRRAADAAVDGCDGIGCCSQIRGVITDNTAGNSAAVYSLNPASAVKSDVKSGNFTCVLTDYSSNGSAADLDAVQQLQIHVRYGTQVKTGQSAGELVT
ncbi:hypothetical protein D3C80_1295040 [compost metagenome]